MKIGIDCRLLSTKVTGIGFYTLNLLNSLAKVDAVNEYKLVYQHKRSVFDQIGNPDTHLYTPDAENFNLAKLYLDVRILDRLIFKLNIPKINWLIGKVDVFHGPYFFPWPVSKGTFIVTVHDLTSFKVPETVRAGLCAYYQRCHNRSIKLADFLIADSIATKHDICEIFDVPEDRIEVVYLGTDLNRDTVADRIDNEPIVKQPYILCVGTLEPRKNQKGLIKAFSILKDMYSIPHKLVLAGDKGWKHEGIIEEAEKSKHKDDIVITGYISPEEVLNLYYYADLFTYVSIYEGFGLPILEAMAMGVPVVYASNTSMIEVAGDAAVGVDTFDLESIVDGMYRVLSDSELADSLTRKGLDRAAQFTWDRTAEETLEVYRKFGN
ncbi:MAG: glycosyltransferase [candidate division Zixibacteria bacterium]|nr:glycosyltransferase [candidate division Zixibacteria bacterium]